MEYKAPLITKDYTIEWLNDFSDSVTIVSCIWTLEAGLVEESSTIAQSGTTSTIHISGGVSGVTYQVKASAIGSNGQSYEQEFYITVKLNIN